MKTLITILALFFSLSLFSQTIDDVYYYPTKTDTLIKDTNFQEKSNIVINNYYDNDDYWYANHIRYFNYGFYTSFSIGWYYPYYSYPYWYSYWYHIPNYYYYWYYDPYFYSYRGYMGYYYYHPNYVCSTYPTYYSYGHRNSTVTNRGYNGTTIYHRTNTKTTRIVNNRRISTNTNQKNVSSSHIRNYIPRYSATTNKPQLYKTYNNTRRKNYTTQTIGNNATIHRNLPTYHRSTSVKSSTIHRNLPTYHRSAPIRTSTMPTTHRTTSVSTRLSGNHRR